MNYNLKLAIRNLLRQRTGTIINVIGLSLSLTACLLIALFVQYELSFERHNKDAKNIYRVLQNNKYPAHPIMFFQPLTENIPELQNGVLIDNQGNQAVKVANENRIIPNVIFSNNNFISFFKLHILSGSKTNPLDVPNACLISKSEADKLFPNDDAVGKIISYNGNHDIEIKAIFEDLPTTTNYRPNLLVNVEAMKVIDEYQYKHKDYSSSHFLFLLPEEVNRELLGDKITEQAKISFENKHYKGKFNFQPITEIHLYSAYTTWDYLKRSDIKMVWIFIITALLILLIAVFNFINLSLALSSKHNLNTGIQKVFGASRKSIFNYFLIENSLVISFCVILALFLVSAFIPLFNQLMEVKLQFSLQNPILWSLILAIGLVCVLFPVMIQTVRRLKINPVLAIKNKEKSTIRTTKSGYSWATQMLTVTQIIITIALITGVVTMNKQANLMLNQKLGFDKSNLITVVNPYVPGSVQDSEKRHQRYKQELEKLPFVEGVTGTFNSPGNRLNNGDWLQYIDSEKESVYAKRSPIDADYFQVMKTKFLLGKAQGIADSSKLVINRSCWEQLGVENPIGMKMKRKFGDRDSYEICGVIEDIQNQSLREQNDAAVYYLADFLFTFVIRLAPGDLQQNIATLESVWNNVESNFPFRYSFVDKDLQANYKKEIRTQKLLTIMSFLAIVLSMLGLFALSIQVIERRTKEIGIRKVNGATITEVLAMLNKDFIKWVVIAFIIATPIAYYAMNKWLENFAYKTTLSWWIFALAGLSALIISLLTVSWQSWRAASKNPVEALRYE